MIILTTSTDTQELRFIPREYTADSILLTDEQDNTSVTIAGSFSQNSYYLTADISFTLIEGRFYTLSVLNGTKIVYKDKIFCTDSTNYSINKNKYTQSDSTNEYITYNE